MAPADRTAAEASRRKHPLFASVMLMLLTEIINSRLFTTVREPSRRRWGQPRWLGSICRKRVVVLWSATAPTPRRQTDPRAV